MVEYCVYYREGGEPFVAYYGKPSWYSNDIPRDKREFPDEIKMLGIPLIKRDKTLDEMTERDFRRWGPYNIRYAAKDVSLSRAEVNH
ncbi:MAG: hypothetical protein AAB340_02565 [Patescibacteria group bacterium]